jgi:hypothetical protein
MAFLVGSGHPHRHLIAVGALLSSPIWRAAMLGMLGGEVAAVTLIEALARACN